MTEMKKHIYDESNGLWCIRRQPAAAGAELNGNGAVPAAAP